LKLPSIRQAIQAAQSTFFRFPFVIVDAAIGTVAALILVDYEGPPGPTILFKILLATILGIPLLTSLVLLGERKRWGTPVALSVQAIGVLLLVGYAFTVPSDLTNAPAIAIIRFFILAFALHLFVATAPFAVRGELNGFWHYNKVLLLRILTSLLYSLVLYVGLSIALAALEKLFGVDVPGKRYGELWIFINGLFTTWFFLAGVPDDLRQLDTLTDYPKGLKIFSQYILFPLVLVYLVILYAYLAKILVSWDWPQGWVSKLILGFSGTSMLALLLLHPVASRAENVWIKTAARWFYVILIPLVIMLFFALWRRISEYGITEGRYLATALGVWLALMVVYFTLSKAKSIRMLPGSLCLLACAVSFGPWGAFAISEHSQVARLQSVLERAAILSEGRVRHVAADIPFEDARQISSLLSYLHDIHGYGGIQQWFGESLRKDTTESEPTFKGPAQVAQMMGLEYVSAWQKSTGGIVYLSADRRAAFEVTGYDHLVHTRQLWGGPEEKVSGGKGISFEMNERMDRMTLAFAREGKGEETLQVDLRQHVEDLLKQYGSANSEKIPPEKMAITSIGEGVRVKVCLLQIQVQRGGQEVKPLMYSADILYSLDQGR